MVDLMADNLNVITYYIGKLEIIKMLKILKHNSAF